jgi:trehalose-6-phosphatase
MVCMNGREPDADFRLAVGDDRTDEDMFAQLPEGSATIRVDPGDTQAVYRVRDGGRPSASGNDDRTTD